MQTIIDRRTDSIDNRQATATVRDQLYQHMKLSFTTQSNVIGLFGANKKIQQQRYRYDRKKRELIMKTNKWLTSVGQH